MNVVQQEPAMSAGIVTAVVSLAAAFGFRWSAAVVAAVLAVLSLVLSVAVRSKVTPAPSPPPAQAAPTAPVSRP